MKSNIKIGTKFGKLTVLKVLGYHIEPSGHRLRKVLVKCDCGNEYELVYCYLKRGDSKHCKQCRWRASRTSKIGDRFDKLTIIGFRCINKRSEVICKCDCGKTKITRIQVLRQNMTNNCGCSRQGEWKGSGKLSGTLFYRIKRSARIRNIKFSLPIRYMWKLYENQKGKCMLSDLSIDFSYRTTGKNTASLDRINSSLGYVKGNVQWVHKDINKMKMNVSEEKFINLCKLVTKHAK